MSASVLIALLRIGSVLLGDARVVCYYAARVLIIVALLLFVVGYTLTTRYITVGLAYAVGFVK